MVGGAAGVAAQAAVLVDDEPEVLVAGGLDAGVPVVPAARHVGRRARAGVGRIAGDRAGAAVPVEVLPASIMR